MKRKTPKYKKQKISHNLVPIQYAIKGSSKSQTFTGNELYRKLLERQEMNAKDAVFMILRDDLPEYVWESLFMTADVACNSERVEIREATLRMFLNYMNNQYFNDQAAREYESFREERLTQFNQLIWADVI